LASGENSGLGKQETPPSVLLLDPLDVYWTTRYPVAESENAEAQRHFELAKKAGLTSSAVSVAAWVPGSGSERPADPDWFRTLQLPVRAMGIEEWELLLGLNTVSDPMGQALADALVLAVDGGYRKDGVTVTVETDFTIDDLAGVVGSDDLDGSYHRETVRGLTQ